jgi:hypothetical protein
MAAKPKASTAVTKAKAKMPVSASLMAAIQADIVEQAQMVQASATNRIKMNSEAGKRYVFPDKSEVTEFEGIIVDFATVQVMYDAPWQPGVINTIVCYAAATKPSELAPLAEVLTPQAADCKTCAKSKFSADGEKPECNLRMHLAILPTDADATTDMLVLDLPVMAAKAFGKYAQATLVGHGAPTWAVVTKFSFDPNVKYDSPRFEVVEGVDGDVGAIIHARRTEARNMLLAAPQITPVEDKKPALKAPKKRA